MLLTKKDEDRFWKKVNKGTANECWEWTAGKAGTGYGAFRLGEQRDGTRPVVPAHIVAFTLHHGYPPKGDLRLRCNNRGCCNPRHLLELIKREEPTTKRHPRQKLAPEDYERVLRLKEAGKKQVEIAAIVGVTQQHVSRLLSSGSRAA